MKVVVQPRGDSSKFGSDAHHEPIAHALDKAEEAAIAVAGRINIVLDAIDSASC